MVPQSEHSHCRAPGMIPDWPASNSFQSVGRMSETPTKCGSRGSRFTAEVGVCLFTLCTGPRWSSLVTACLSPRRKFHCVEPHIPSNRKAPIFSFATLLLVVQYTNSRILNRQSKAHSYAGRLPHYTNPRSSPLFQLRPSSLSHFLGRYARIRNFTPQSPPQRMYPLCDRICNRSNEFAMK